MAVSRFEESVCNGADYFSVIRLPVVDLLQHFIKAKYVFCSHKIVAKHDEVHLAVYFLQAFE